MKNQLLSAILLLFLAGACRSDASIESFDLLYQRWHMIQSLRIGTTNWIQPDTDAYYDTEYRRDGTIVYRRDGVVLWGEWCSPKTFNRQASILTPTSLNICPNGSCVAPRPGTITQLTKTLLEVNTGTYIYQYEPIK